MRIAFRTEGNHRQGMGDVWGAIALAQACLPAIDQVVFLVSSDEEAAALVRGQGFPLHLVPSLDVEKEALRSFRPDVLLSNRLNSPPGYIRAVRDLVGFIVTMEDTGPESLCADLRINLLYQTEQAAVAIGSPATAFGPAVSDPIYMALRKEFQAFQERPKTIREKVQELLVIQGGSDTRGFTPQILRSLERARCRPHCTVVTGPAFRHDAELEEARAASTWEITHLKSPEGMAGFLAQADCAITAGGITLFELACVGTPSLVVCAEPFEMETALKMEKAGAAVNLGYRADGNFQNLPEALDALAHDPLLRRRMSACGKRLVDGRGSGRILHLIRQRLGLAEAPPRPPIHRLVSMREVGPCRS